MNYHNLDINKDMKIIVLLNSGNSKELTITISWYSLCNHPLSLWTNFPQHIEYAIILTFLL